MSQNFPNDGRIAWYIPNFLSNDQLFGYHEKLSFHIFPKAFTFSRPVVYRIDIYRGKTVLGNPILTELRECPSILECMRGCQDFADRYQPAQNEVPQ